MALYPRHISDPVNIDPIRRCMTYPVLISIDLTVKSNRIINNVADY
jgi:hypothetical protein